MLAAGLSARFQRDSLRPVRIAAVPIGLLLSLVPYGAFLVGGWLLGVSWGRGGNAWERLAAALMLAVSAALEVRRH
jgi:hypothetical protein